MKTLSDEMGGVVACTCELTSGHANSKAAHIQGHQPFLPPKCSGTRPTESEASEGTLTSEHQTMRVPEHSRVLKHHCQPKFVGVDQFSVTCAREAEHRMATPSRPE